MTSEPSIFDIVVHASLAVQLILILLMGASVLSWAVIITKWRQFSAAKKHAQQFADQFWSGANLARLYETIRDRKASSEGLENIFFAGFREYVRLQKTTKKGNVKPFIETAERATKVAISQEETSLEKWLSFLATVGSVSPYVGLFGTVWGIMHAFMALGGVGQASLSLVAPGIAEALIATAAGLFAAIPAVVAYNRFIDDAEQLEIVYENFQEEFISLLHRRLASASSDDEGGH